MTNKQPSRRRRLMDAASGYLDLEMPDHALRELNQIEDQIEEPGDSRFDLLQLQGEAFRQKEQYDEALQVFQKSLQENPDALTVLLGMAWCYKRIDKLPRAIETMQQAYRAFPKEAIVLYNLSCYFALAGDKVQTLSWLGRALRLEKDLRHLIADESDFDQFRNDPDFQFVACVRDLTDAT